MIYNHQILNVPFECYITVVDTRSDNMKHYTSQYVSPIYSVVLSVAVYSSEVIVDGATVAALINENKDDFDTSISHAVVG